MPENIRALVVILAIVLVFFALVKKQVCHLAFEDVDFQRRRNVWLAVVSFYFIAANFWLFMLLSSIAILMAAAHDTNKFSLYLILLFAAPQVSNDIPGFGILNYLVAVNYLNLLSIFILLPYWIKLTHDPEIQPLGSTWGDRFALGYIILPLILQGLDDTLTNTLRQGFVSFLDLFLPYYIASRSLRHIRACRDIIMAFTIGILVLAPLGLFEYLWKWLLYANVPASMGIYLGSFYLDRGGSLRAMASAGHSLVLGYLMVIAAGLYAYSRRMMPSQWLIMLGLVVLLAGLWSPLSRGPWLGALLVLAVIYATGDRPLARSVKLLLVCMPVVGLVLLSPLGEKIIPLIPFVGSIADVTPQDDFNRIYRQRLLQISLNVIEAYPFFGSFHFRELPVMQSLIQGQGIIDIVNAYLMVALTYGLVGLSFYLGMFLCALRAVWVGYRACPVGDELHTLGRALLAVLLGVMLTISGVGGSFSISTINMLVIGLCLSYADLVGRAQLSALSAQQEQPLFSGANPA